MITPDSQVATSTPRTSTDGWLHWHAQEELMIYQAVQTGAQFNELIDEFELVRDDTPGCPGLCIDCDELADLDGAGLQLLLLASRQLRSSGGRLRLAGLNDRLFELLAVLNLTDDFLLERRAD